MNSRDKRRSQGKFTSQKNRIEQVDGCVFVFAEYGDLLFYTEEKTFEKLGGYNFGKMANGYACAYKNGTQISVHRLITDAQKGDIVDHINRNKKDNRLANLRIVNKSINAFNSKARRDNEHTGVWFRKDTNKWVAEIKKDYVKHCLGCFDTKEEATRKRKEAEVLYYGCQWKG